MPWHKRNRCMAQCSGIGQQQIQTEPQATVAGIALSIQQLCATPPVLLNDILSRTCLTINWLLD